MTGLLVLLLIVAIVFALRKPRPSVVATSEPVYTHPVVIEDSSHLKSDLAATQEKLAILNQELGQLQSKFHDSLAKHDVKDNQYATLQEQFLKLQHQNKSSQVKTGQITEQVAVLLPQFPCPIDTVKFFGSPIDFISIDLEAEKIMFIEIKTGSSALSERQRKVRKMIQEKKIEFAEVRIDGKEVTVKKS